MGQTKPLKIKRSKIAYVLLLMYHKFYLSNLQNDDKNWKIEPFLHEKQKYNA